MNLDYSVKTFTDVFSESCINVKQLDCRGGSQQTTRPMKFTHNDVSFDIINVCHPKIFEQL